MPYSIVETVEDGEKLCTAVPSIWIQQEGKSLKWPGKKFYMKYLKMGKKPESHWESYPISRILIESITTWSEARKKERMLEYTSCTEDHTRDIRKKRKKEKDYSERVSSEDEFDMNYLVEHCQDIISKPIATPVYRQNAFIGEIPVSQKPQQNLQNTQVSSEPYTITSSSMDGNADALKDTTVRHTLMSIENHTSTSPASEHHDRILANSTTINKESQINHIITMQHQNTTHGPLVNNGGNINNSINSEYVICNPSTVNSGNYINISPTIYMQSNENGSVRNGITMPLPTHGNELRRTTGKRFLMDITNNINTPVCNKTCPTCCCSANNVSTLIYNIQGSLMLMNEGLEGLFSEVKSISRNMKGGDTAYFNLLPKMPLNSIEDLQSLERNLSSNTEMKKQLTEKFRQLGGKGVSASLRKCMRFLAIDDIYTKFSWLGIKNNKLKFSTLQNILDSLYESIIKNNTGGTQSSIDECIKNWIKHAPERIKNIQQAK